MRLAKEGDKGRDMGKGGRPNPEQKGGGSSGSLCLTLGTGPLSLSLNICHAIVNYH